ncbi:uncharacterized protein LOC132833383 isoform X3 [Hemiscyllium ocellatum]|uniref:uncharacterized protein LOC132833383 isoform X3 n=1 Tax=Hemiscyllium ocellatum TaxID=170820 RepID=UPI002967104C|nr:uncharacterized protein LOC132833383 isoform X3 [Hemiscyllium ocellatum]
MRSPLGAALLLHLFCHSFAGGSLSPSVTPASSEFPSSISSTSTLKKTRIPLDSTAHSVPGTPTAGPPPSSWNESSSSRAPFGSSSTAKAKDITSQQSTAVRDQVTLISVRMTDTDAGKGTFWKDNVAENGKVEDCAQIHNQ